MLKRTTKNRHEIIRPDNEPGIECVHESTKKTGQNIEALVTETLKLVVTMNFADQPASWRPIYTERLAFDFSELTALAIQLDTTNLNNDSIHQVIADYCHQSEQPIDRLVSSALSPSLRNIVSQITRTPININPAYFAAGTNSNTFYADMNGNLQTQPQTAAQAAQQAAQRHEFDGETDSEPGSINGDNGYGNGPDF